MPVEVVGVLMFKPTDRVVPNDFDLPFMQELVQRFEACGYDRVLVPAEADLPVDPSTDCPPGYTATQRGVAGITVCSTIFEPLGRAQAKALGYAELPIAALPHPFGSRTPEQLRELAPECADAIARLAEAVAGRTNAGAGVAGTAFGAAAARAAGAGTDVSAAAALLGVRLDRPVKIG